MPECLRDDDSISAMLERGTLERDFALSMQALGFGDEPTTYKHKDYFGTTATNGLKPKI